MRKLRVLVVDDSMVIRRMLTDILEAEPDMEVAGTAADGSIALAKLASANADVVTLDVEMPGMSGLDVLAEIKRMRPALPVVMFSAATERAAATTLEALARGATDYVTKPSQTGSRDASIQHVRSQLITKLRSLGLGRPSVALPSVPCTRPAPVRAPATALRLVAIGASTGGPNAISTLATRLPRLPVPIVIAQHMPAVFTRLFAERLSACGQTRFCEAHDHQLLEPGCGYIAPGDYHMRVVRDGVVLRAELDQTPPENSVRPAVDVTFRSAADATRGAMLAVVLTGMGQDGLRGCEVIRRAGGTIIAQDEQSSVVWGMPGVVARARLADAVVPLDDISSEILRSALPAGGRRVG